MSSKLIYALVAVVALVTGVVYKMGWLSKAPSGETVSAAVSAVSAVAKNTPILRAKVPDVFDGEVPPHSDEPLVSETLQKQDACPASTEVTADVSPASASNAALIEPVVATDPVSSIKLDSSLPSITLNTDVPTSAEAEMPNISINI